MGGTAEVLGEAFEHHLVVAPPRHEAERPRPHRMAREPGAALVHLLARHDRGRVVGDEVQERRERPLEAQLDGRVVDHAHAGNLGGRALDELGRPDQLLEHPGPLAAGRALERVLHVGRAHLAAIVELRAATEVEGVGAVIGGDHPALGERGSGHELVVQLQQGVEDLADHRGRRQIARVGGIQRWGIGHEHHPQRAAGLRGAGGAGEPRDDHSERERGDQRRARHEPGSSVTAVSRCRPVGCRRRLRTSGRVTPHTSRT